ncbi:FkbM family methyltransferase [Bosea sp. NPDC003192]|uniref:FkbM family methyltransferase n=1 Tax=Bosea sp. NPDC003192 TaxID=3390551 RepID=UPI003CFDA979
MRKLAGRPSDDHRHHKQSALADLLVSSTPERFGVDLADALEHRPEMTLDVVNQRVIAYQFLAHLGNIIRRFRIDTIIDAGAHSGQYASTVYGYAGFKGQIHSFEPVKRYFDVLNSHLHYYPGWSAYNLALGDEPGPAQIFVGGGHGGTSSLLAQTEHLTTFASANTLGEPEDIEVRRVDDMFGEALSDPERRVMLKLDVQGFEERVLRSAGRFVESFKLVQVEVSSVDLYAGQGSVGAIVSYLENLGYTLVFTVNSFSPQPSIFIDYDFIFCRRSEIVS